ncbi:MAG: sulfatase-like hydrolase/transferase, partial [Planctomycetales bacterium]|nr:sulfatase-like hydrolase/transferase [Planctomycetales bacterium]
MNISSKTMWLAYVAGATLLLPIAACEVRRADAARLPNVLLVMTDDQGFGDFSVNGNPHLRTPHVDSLAKQGVRFDRFYVNSFCAPTRAALLTGRYPLRCGVWGVTHNKECMRSSEVTLGEAFQQAGYQTACIGKWHNGEQYPYTPPGQGFDLFFGFHNGHINNYFDTRLIRGAKPEPTRGYITDVLTDEALRFIESNRQRPFFCYVAYNAPHSPYQIPDRYYDRFAQQGFDPAVAAFYGMCENIDDNMGRLLETLERLDLADDTIVLFLTDNGGTAGVKIYNAGMRGGKTSVHEGGCRVPLFVRWPGKIAGGREVPQLASHIDIYPTLLDLCQITAPAGPPLDGVSLRPLLTAGEVDWPERTLFTHNPISADNRYPGAVRTSRFRLVREIRGPQGGSSARPNDQQASAWQLYDMQVDPGEKRDLANERPEIVESLSAQYENWIDETHREPLERLPIPVGYEQENPVTLHAPQAFFEGELRFYSGPGFAHDWLTNWTATDERVWFDVDVVKAGEYELALKYAVSSETSGPNVRVSVGETQGDAVPLKVVPAPLIPLPHRDERGKQRYRNREWSRQSLGNLSLG